MNQKIEGFFDLCRIASLTGEQGVMVPAQNVQNLMLREEVVEAIADRRFSVWPVTTIEEGIELLTGVPAGDDAPTGAIPRTSSRGTAAPATPLPQLRRSKTRPGRVGSRTEPGNDNGHDARKGPTSASDRLQSVVSAESRLAVGASG